ncbi:MAG TPA: BPSS1780 family membrane protein [Limnobacter sp.]|uniref:BPSS1780 family membrane protein n=1 Tax=Limnobacter sp. TaxID=2003368 RepID=UPI002ED7E764
MATHLHICTPRQGWEWLMTGLSLFRKKPSELFLLGNTYLFILLFVGMLIPMLGAAVVTLLTPALGFGIMLAGKMMKSGLRVSPSILFAGFGQAHRPHLRRLLQLGFVYTVSFAAIRLLANAVLGGQPTLDVSNVQKMDPDHIVRFYEYMASYLSVVALASLPVILAFWFAPVLVVWHGMSPGQALFSSWVAVWRNKSAFLIYGMGWIILSVGFCSAVVAVFSLLGLPASLLSALNILTMAVVMSASLATFYPSYTAVFEHDPEHFQAQA